MFQFNFRVEPGVLQQINQDLLRLPEEIRSRVIRPAVREACGPLERSYRNALRRHRSSTRRPQRRDKSGNYVPRPHLDEVVKTKIWTIPNRGGYVGYIGARSGDARHAHLLERGSYLTGERRRRNGASTGVMPAFFPQALSIGVALPDARHRFLDTVITRLAYLNQSAPIP